MTAHETPTLTTSMRLDKWLWCARFYKTRALAVEEIGKGRVTVNKQAAKAAKDIRAGDTIALRQGSVARTVIVRQLSNYRGPAPVAQQLYEETADSIAARLQATEQRRLAPEPADTIAAGRPTKRDRRDMERATSWNNRWSASHEE